MKYSTTYLLSDFDATLTQAYINGTKRPSLISVLRDHDYLGSDYADQAKALYAKYAPLEDDTSLTFEQRKEAMTQRRGEHFELLIQKGLHKTHLQHIIDEGHIQMREGYQELFAFLHDQQIPMIIISASGLGVKMIQMMLEHAGVDKTHIHVISNQLVFDNNGLLQSVKTPYIHTLNKDETEIHAFGYEKHIQGRDKIVLLGDKLGDLRMSYGADYASLFSFGFLNNSDVSEEIKKTYYEQFDSIIENDGSLLPVLEYMRQ